MSTIVITDVWVCVDCLGVAAGITEEEQGHPYPKDPAPWEEFSTSIGSPTPGSEERTFSTSPCEGCGSTLAGSRHLCHWLADETDRVKHWRVQAQVNVQLADGYVSTRQVPTFLLDTSIAGVLDERTARRVADDILCAMAGDSKGVTLSIHLEPVYDV